MNNMLKPQNLQSKNQKILSKKIKIYQTVNNLNKEIC